MKTLSIRAAIGLAVLILGAGYLRAQTTPTTKSEILLDFELTKNGSAIGKPSLRMADGVTATLELQDGTQVKVTGKIVAGIR